MLGPERLLADLEGLLVERFGLRVRAYGSIKLREVVEAQRRVGMFWPKNLLPDPERFLKERLGFSIRVHGLVQRGKVIEAGRRVGML